MRTRAFAALILYAALVVALPLAGLAASGAPVAPWLAFPPRTEFVPHAPFAWGPFIVLALLACGAIAPFPVALARARPGAPRPPARAFPLWGWFGIALLASGWVLAWSEVTPPQWRRHTFTPLWLGYILIANALSARQTGCCLLTRHPGFFLALFPASAAFWWLFEYLNQFTDNWYYAGIQARDDLDYFLQATPPFSTVLPAVISTWWWLRHWSRIETITLPPMRLTRGAASVALAAGAAALAAIGHAPEALFAMLWLAPPLLLFGLARLVVGESLLDSLAAGDWRPLLQPALAALACGFFWELWNWGSLAKWHYSIPYVQVLHVFEMPLLGYAGYLPFGVACALAADLLSRALGCGALWPPEDDAGAASPGTKPGAGTTR